MSLYFTNQDLCVLIAVPITLIVQTWTLTIYRKNRRQWRAYDIPIVAILVESTLRNLATLAYVVLERHLWTDKCIAFVWFFNSAHTFHASCLLTLSAVGAFRARMRTSEQLYLTPAHVVYHLLCITTLCACVGVAAILADATPNFDIQCHLLPHQLDVKYKAFFVVLHSFLSIVAVTAAVYANLVATRGRFDKSPSQLSLSTTITCADQYDTYTIRRHLAWKDFASNISTTTSTNSRRPLKPPPEEEHNGLESINTILLVGYLLYHFPVIALNMYPDLLLWNYYVRMTPLSTILWLGLLQDIAIPLALGLFDSRFNKWVAHVYSGRGNSPERKLPHVGLDGRFRHFGSQPQSLDYQMQPILNQKFPITNGSLYTNMFHNYRRPFIAVRPNCENCGLNVRQAYQSRNSSLSQENLKQIPLGNEEVTQIRAQNYHLNSFECGTTDTESQSSITTEANGDFEFFQRSLDPQPHPQPSRLNKSTSMELLGAKHEKPISNSVPDLKQIFITEYL